jgi:hypothetical protein
MLSAMLQVDSKDMQAITVLERDVIPRTVIPRTVIPRTVIPRTVIPRTVIPRTGVYFRSFTGYPDHSTSTS